ncbi:unnamed protein product [Calicophoron daubneyi]|uniref:Protein kinase domain-containing protein n=1 Tax=Calicophoron daubneyi TaxID=300641 RepID=A0AAV2T2T7_CALDB
MESVIGCFAPKPLRRHQLLSNPGLEEISNTDGIPHCPVCLSAWETIPFEDMTLEKCSSTGQLVQKAYSPENSSSVCPCQALRSIMNESAQTFNRGDEDIERNEKTCGPLVRHSTPRSSPPYPEYENCIAAFSQEIADGIASEHCVTARQLALQQAAQLTVRRIILIRQQHKIQTTADSSSDAVVKHGPVLDRSQKVPPNNSSAPQIQSPSEPDCLRVMFRLIQHLFDDPVDSIFIDALRAFRELLGFLVCFNAETQMALQRAIGPILRRLLRFVGGASVLWTLRNHAIGTGDGLPNRTSILTRQASIDSTEISSCSNPHFATEKQVKKTSEKGSVDAAAPVNVVTEERGSAVDSRTMHETVPPPLANLRDRANLALATLVELAKGQSGALAVGRDVGCASHCLPVCGLQHMTRFILSSAKFHATHLIGRLTLLDKLIRMDQTQLTLSSSLSTGPGSVNCAESRLRSGAKQFPTETSKQAAQQSQHQQQQQQSYPQNGPDFLARRHLCSSLVFARRHLLPPTPNPALAVCFPSYYQAQPLPSSSSSSSMLTSGNEVVAKPVLINSIEHQNQAVDSLYNTQLKASRVARRVFLTASRSLLTYNERHPNERSNLLNSNQKTSAYGGREFCPREFVEVEINRTEAPLAAWLRNKLAPLLYPNLIPGLDAPLLPIRMTVSEAPPGVPPRGQSQQPNLDRGRQMITTSRTIGDISVTSREDRSKRSVLTPSPDRAAQSPSCPPSPPPVPPPRRCAGLRSASEIRPQRSCKRPNERGNEGILPAVHSSSPISSQYVAVALEPAYDLVALSESGNYNTVSEGEEEDAAEDDPCEQKGGDNNDFPPEEAAEPTYGGRSLGSEAELQTEQAAVLRCALRRCSRSLRPLLPVPALTIVMDAFRNTHKLPSTDEYYESVDWVRGPILGHGAFSQCYQARDTRTGLLMAVKRIRLGGGSVFPIVTDKSKPQPRTERFLEPPLDKNHLKKKAEQCNPDKDDKTERDPTRPLSPASASQLTEVQAEVDTMLRLSHPNVLRLFGAVYCARRGLVDLFIEWMPGGSITGLLHQYGAFNEPVTLAYGVQVIRGLAYLHKHGILHRDLKGANLLVDTTGSVVRISDFGASARLSGEKSVAGQFRGQVIGTFSFMAPEVLRGQAYGRACDIWSVGCCLIEMLTSKPPWHDRRLTNRYALIYEIATSDSPPPYPESVDENIVTVLDSCFARNPSERPTASKLLTFRAFAKLTEPHNVFTSHSMRRLCDPCVYAEGQAVKRPVWDGSSTGSGTLPITSRVAEVDLKQIQKPEWPFSHSTTRVA